jgi:phage terminase large subunit-like protein
MKKTTKKQLKEEIDGFPERLSDDQIDAYMFALETLYRSLTIWQRIKYWFKGLFWWFK